MSVYQQGAATSTFIQHRPEGVGSEAVSYQGASAVIGTGPVTNSAPGLIGVYEEGSMTTGEIQKGKRCTLMRTRLNIFTNVCVVVFFVSVFGSHGNRRCSRQFCAHTDTNTGCQLTAKPGKSSHTFIHTHARTRLLEYLCQICKVTTKIPTAHWMLNCSVV